MFVCVMKPEPNHQSLPSAHVAWSTISDIAEIVQPKATTRAEFIAEAKSGALDGVSVAYRTFDSASVTGRIDGELLDALPRSLKFLCHNGKKPTKHLHTIYIYI